MQKIIDEDWHRTCGKDTDSIQTLQLKKGKLQRILKVDVCLGTTKIDIIAGFVHILR